MSLTVNVAEANVRQKSCLHRGSSDGDMSFVKTLASVALTVQLHFHHLKSSSFPELLSFFGFIVILIIRV